MQQQSPGHRRVVNTNDDDRLDALAQQSADGLLFLALGISAVDNNNLKARIQKNLMQRLQVFRKDDIVERWHNDAHRMAA